MAERQPPDVPAGHGFLTGTRIPRPRPSRARLYMAGGALATVVLIAAFATYNSLEENTT
jgi:hypothetical protein